MAQIFGTQAQLNALLEAVTIALASAESCLVRLHTFPSDSEAIQRSYQQMHVIGRAASVLEWPQLALLAHGTEGMLSDVMDNLTRLDPPTLTHMQSSLGTMKLLIQCLQSPDRPATWPPTLEGMGNVVAAVQETDQREENRRTGEQEVPSASFDERTNADTREKERHLESVAPRKAPPIQARPAEETTHRSLVVIVKLQQQRQSGVLVLKRGSAFSAEEGSIRFEEGRIVSAQAGRRSGPDARNWLSTWGTCRFAFYPDEQNRSP